MSLSTTTTGVPVREARTDLETLRRSEPGRGRPALLLLAAMLVSCTTVTALLPVDRLVSSTLGAIVTGPNQTVFQALDASIVKSVDVQEGQAVQKGELLATLDPTFAAADVDQLHQQVANLTAEIARDAAELHKQPYDPAPDSTPGSVSYTALEKQLFDQRAAQYAAQMLSYDEKIKQQQATIVKLQTDAARYEAREKIAQQLQDMRSTLFKSGSSSLLNLLTATDQRLEMQRTMEFGRNSLLEAQHQIVSLAADRDAFLQKWYGDISQDLVTSQTTLDQAQASLDKAVKHQDLVRLVAPAAGTVLSIATPAAGQILKPGDTVMTLSPTDVPIDAEVRVASGDVGFLRPGQTATLKIDAFDSSAHGTATGHVKWVSDGSFTTDDSGTSVDPYYKVRVGIDTYHFVDVPSTFRLIPGMTLTADINVGKRSFARYAWGQLTQSVGESMREP